MSNKTINNFNLHNDNLADVQQQHFYEVRADPFQTISYSNKFCILNWQISYQTNYGERLAIVGNIQQLGNWKKEDALNLQWNNNNIWKGQAIINFSQLSNDKQILEYKYILIDEKNQKIQWEEGQNRFYYYNQIIAECQENQNILFKNSKYSNDQTILQNNNIKHHHCQQRMQPLVNKDQVSKCTDQMFIYDVWNKKSIIFRIKDMNQQDQGFIEQILDRDNMVQNLDSYQHQVQKTQLLKAQSQNSKNLIKESSSSPYFHSASIKIEDDSEKNLLQNQESNSFIQIQSQNKKLYYITGNHKELGNLRNPQKMNYIPEKQIWELQIYVDRNTEYIRYFYIQKEGNNQLEWEKGSGRFIYMQPLINEQSFDASAIGSCKQSSIYSSHSLSDIDFEDLKTEFLTQSQNRTNNYNSITNKPITESIQNTEVSCQSQNKINKRLQGKIKVNTLNKGIFLCEDNEISLDFSLSFDNISDYLYIGPYISNNISDIKQLKQFGIDTVLSLQTDDDMQRRSVDKNYLKEQYKKNGIEYYNIPIKDKSFQDFYHKGLRAVEKLNTLLKNQKRTVYLHCTGGISRAPQTAILYLSLYKNYSLKNATKFVCNKREAAFPDEQLMHQVYNNIFENNQG
ncbi:hypothetical protein ABPG74_005429 [Tetrahymena malaccensis]